MVDAETYWKSLIQRAHEAVVVKCVRVALGQWSPLPNHCHENVSYFCEHSLGYEPVNGWLYLEHYPGHDSAKFLAHSVVRAPDGELFDVTPWEATEHYPFLASGLSQDDYAKFI
jgi:hypothetical protein